MKFRGTWIAILVVAALVGFTIYDGMRVQKAESEKLEAKRLFKVNASEIVKVEVIDEKPARVLEKVEGQWLLVAPLKDRADIQEVNALLEAIEQETALEVVSESTSEVATFGLDRPGLTAKVTTSDGRVQVLEFGSISSYDGNLYVRRGQDSKIYLVGAVFEGQFNKSILDFRDKHLYRGKPGALFTKIELDQRDPKSKKLESLRLEKSKDGKWSMAGYDLPLEVPAIEAFMEQVRALRAFDFTEKANDLSSKRSSNLDPPLYRVHLSNESGDTFSVEVGPGIVEDEKSPRIASSSDLPVLINIYGAAFSTIRRRAEDFLDRKAPFSYQVNDATRVEILAPRAKVPYEAKFEKKGPDWELVDSKGGLQKESKTSKLNDVLTRMSVLEAVRFLGPVSESKMVFDSAIRLLRKDGSIEFEMKWGKPVTASRGSDDPEATFVPVMTSASKRIVGIPSKNLEDLGVNEL